MVSKPKAPDPVRTANAQGQMNKETAIAQANLNAVDYVTPYGNITTTQTGTWADGTPKYTQTTQLSDTQRQVLDQTQGAQQNLASIANSQSDFLKNYLSSSVDTSGVPALSSSADGYNQMFSGNIGNGFSSNFSPDIGGSYTDTVSGNYATSYAGADDFSADRKSYEDALWSRTASDRAQQEDHLRSTLAAKGIREGSAAWNAEMQRLGAQNTDARLATLLAGGQEQARMVGLARQAAQFGNDAILNRFNAQNSAALASAGYGSSQQQAQNAAALAQAGYGTSSQLNQNAAALAQQQAQNAARSQGLAEVYAARNQPLNEINSLISGSQIINPNTSTSAVSQTPVAGVDYTGLVQQKYQADLASSQSKMGGLFGLLGAGITAFSDRRLKENIRKVGETFNGTPIYIYNFIGDPTPQMGVMAQELAEKQPEAVVLDPSGYLKVLYAEVR